MNKKILLILTFLVCSFYANAQKGMNGIQIAGQASIPTGRLSDVVNTGFGASAKGMYGFSKIAQFVTLEAGYNRFSVKNLPSSVSANYSAIPVYTGYRANLGGIVLEGQAGVSFNHVEGSGPSGTVSSNQTAFGWAISAGYAYRNIELDLKYQNSESDNDTYVIRFVGIRLGYNFGL
jgi:hypothetical protein